MTIKSSPFIKSLILILLPIILFLNACKKGISDISPSLTDVCLIAKRTQFNPEGKITSEDTYTYNSMRLVSAIKHYSTGVDGTFTDTEVFQYNSDGQIIKQTSANSTASYIYKNKLLIDENAIVGDVTFSTKYSYNTDSKKTKVIFKSSTDNKIWVNFEETYDYQDTLLIRVKNRSLIAEKQKEDFDYEFKYDEQHRLVERKTLRTNSLIYEIRKYQYDSDGNVVKMIELHSDYDTVQENSFTYINNKLVEQIMSFTNTKGEVDPVYKTVFEYKGDNLSKKTYFENENLRAYEQYAYTCDK